MHTCNEMKTNSAKNHTNIDGCLIFRPCTTSNLRSEKSPYANIDAHIRTSINIIFTHVHIQRQKCMFLFTFYMVRKTRKTYLSYYIDFESKLIFSCKDVYPWAVVRESFGQVILSTSSILTECVTLAVDRAKDLVDKNLIPARIHSKYGKQDAWRRATVSELVPSHYIVSI